MLNPLAGDVRGYDMGEKRFVRRKIFVVLISLIFVGLAVNYCSKNISRELETQMHNSMRTAARQNKASLEREIVSQYNLLKGISVKIQNNQDGVHKLIDQLGEVVDIYDFKRIGFVDKSGVAYTTDGYNRDLSFREFYRKGMQGTINITSTIDDSLGEKEKINVFSIPVYDGDNSNVIGVLFATYKAEKFQAALDFGVFDGDGNTCIISETGRIITKSANSKLGDEENFFDELNNADSQNNSVVTMIKSDISEKKNGHGDYVNSEKYHFYYEPVSLFDGDIIWYIITIVPETYLKNQESPMLKYINELLLIQFIVLIICLSCYIFFHHSKQKVLKKYIYKDPLTKGDSLAAFQEKLIDMRKHNGYAVSLDLNNFKMINNTCGIQKGDEVIIKIWEVICNNIHKDELAAHVNADNFVMFLMESDDDVLSQRINKMADEIRKLSKQLNIPHIVPSFGVYNVKDYDEMQKEFGKANMAKKLVKGRRDRHCAFYSELDLEKIEEQQEIEDDFYKSIEEERFELWYQPKFGKGGNSIDGAEVLVRWRNEKGELISPARFIPFFEKNGMISTLDEYVFDHVCRQQKDWQNEGREIIPVSVNISRASLYYTDIVERYTKIINGYKLDPMYVQLEVTESAIIDNEEVDCLVNKFQNKGFKMLMDDFGHGYSSISVLNKACFDVLKIDKSLIDGIGEKTGEVLLTHLIALAQELGMSITAEGVENKQQAEFIWNLKCDEIQGYYYSKPLNKHEFEQFLIKHM